MKQHNVAIAGFQHETNTFSPNVATLAEFVKLDSWPGLTKGAAVLRIFRGMNLPIAGYIEKMLADNHSNLCLHPILWASAEPCGYVTKHAYELIAQSICDGIAAINNLSGVYLDLHGAMVAKHVADGEGELLRRIRAIVGTEVPILVSLDLHANISPSMVQFSSAITIFRTYPHLDMAATGARAYTLLNRLLSGDILYKGFAQIPFLVPLTSQCTDFEPCKFIYQELKNMLTRDATLVSADFALGFPPADTYDCGPSIVVYGFNQARVNAALKHLEQLVLSFEEQFSGDLWSVDEAVQNAVLRTEQDQQPIVIADVQDNPGAGASSDTMGIVKALLNNRAQNAYVAVINDADTCRQAYELEVGSRFHARLGGKSGVIGDQPLDCLLEVCRLANGVFAFTGEMYKGITANVGPMALVRIVQAQTMVYVIVGVTRIQCLDLAILKHLQLEPEQADIIVVKSSVHFRADFDAISAATLLVASPGFHPCELADVKYRYLRPNMRRC